MYKVCTYTCVVALECVAMDFNPTFYIPSSLENSSLLHKSRQVYGVVARGFSEIKSLM